MVMYAGGGESRTGRRGFGRLPLDHLKHLPRNVLALLLDVGEDTDLDGPVAEGDLDDVAGLDGLAGLGGLAVDEDAARVGHLVCYRAALDEPRNFQIFVQTHF